MSWIMLKGPFVGAAPAPDALDLILWGGLPWTLPLYAPLKHAFRQASTVSRKVPHRKFSGLSHRTPEHLIHGAAVLSYSEHVDMIHVYPLTCGRWLQGLWQGGEPHNPGGDGVMHPAPEGTPGCGGVHPHLQSWGAGSPVPPTCHLRCGCCPHRMPHPSLSHCSTCSFPLSCCNRRASA